METTAAAGRGTRRVVPAQRSAPPDRPVRRTQAERRAESERRLLRAAAELIVERGIEGTSLAEIGRRAGYSHGLVHQRFGSKDALIERLNSEAVRLFAAATTSRVGGTRGIDALLRTADGYLSVVRAADPIGRVHLVVWSESLGSGESTRPYRVTWDRHFRSALVRLIRSGHQDGTVRTDLPPESMAVLIVGVLRGVALQLMIDPGAADHDAAHVVILDRLAAMLAPRDGTVTGDATGTTTG